MNAKYLLNGLRGQVNDGCTLHVADSFQGGVIRLVYRVRPDGIITGWQVEGPGLDFPATFPGEEQARAFIRGRWGIDPRTKRWGEP